jgi:hypothetical protein
METIRTQFEERARDMLERMSVIGTKQEEMLEAQGVLGNELALVGGKVSAVSEQVGPPCQRGAVGRLMENNPAAGTHVWLPARPTAMPALCLSLSICGHQTVSSQLASLSANLAAVPARVTARQRLGHVCTVVTDTRLLSLSFCNDLATLTPAMCMCAVCASAGGLQQSCHPHAVWSAE